MQRSNLDSDEKSSRNLLDLPPEILLHLFSFFMPAELCRIATASKTVNLFASHNLLWKKYTHGVSIPDVESKMIVKRYAPLFQPQGNYFTRLSTQSVSLQTITSQLDYCFLSPEKNDSILLIIEDKQHKDNQQHKGFEYWDYLTKQAHLCLSFSTLNLDYLDAKIESNNSTQERLTPLDYRLLSLSSSSMSFKESKTEVENAIKNVTCVLIFIHDTQHLNTIDKEIRTIIGNGCAPLIFLAATSSQQKNILLAMIRDEKHFHLNIVDILLLDSKEKANALPTEITNKLQQIKLITYPVADDAKLNSAKMGA